MTLCPVYSGSLHSGVVSELLFDARRMAVKADLMTGGCCMDQSLTDPNKQPKVMSGITVWLLIKIILM